MAPQRAHNRRPFVTSQSTRIDRDKGRGNAPIIPDHPGSTAPHESYLQSPSTLQQSVDAAADALRQPAVPVLLESPALRVPAGRDAGYELCSRRGSWTDCIVFIVFSDSNHQISRVLMRDVSGQLRSCYPAIEAVLDLLLPSMPTHEGCRYRLGPRYKSQGGKKISRRPRGQ